LTFREEVAHDVEELGPARNARGHGDLTAGAWLAFEEGDLVTAGGRGRGRLQACRSATDDHHPPPTPRWDGQRDGLPACAGVLDAAEPAIEPHPADALLVAGQAGPDR
jgi:hypothetical protein